MEASKFAARTEKEKMNRKAKEVLDHAEMVVRNYGDVVDGKTYLRATVDTLLKLDYLSGKEYIAYYDAIGKSNY